MRKEIKIEIQYTIEDYVRALSFIQKQIRQRSFYYKYESFISVIIVFSTFVIGIYLLANDKKTINYFSVFIIAFGSALLFGFLIYLVKKIQPFFLKRSISKQFKSSIILNKSQIMSLNEEGVEGQNSLGSNKIKWEAFLEATETKDDFFFFTTNKFAQFIPKRFFTEEQIKQVREIVKEKLGDKAKF